MVIVEAESDRPVLLHMQLLKLMNPADVDANIAIAVVARFKEQLVNAMIEPALDDVWDMIVELFPAKVQLENSTIVAALPVTAMQKSEFV